MSHDLEYTHLDQTPSLLNPFSLAPTMTYSTPILPQAPKRAPKVSQIPAGSFCAPIPSPSEPSVTRKPPRATSVFVNSSTASMSINSSLSLNGFPPNSNRRIDRHEVVWDMHSVSEYTCFVLGANGSGKTTLISQYNSPSPKELAPEYSPTLQETCARKQVKLLDRYLSPDELSTILLNVIDTPSSFNPKELEQKFKATEDGVGFMCVYAINCAKSFEIAQQFLTVLSKMTKKGEPPSVILVGTKLDLIESGKEVREVEYERAKQVAESVLYCPFFEISGTMMAHSAVEDLFCDFIREVSFHKQNSSLPLEKAGYLEKKTTYIWKKYWFVMQDGVLSYYLTERDAQKNKLKSTIDLTNSRIEDHSKYKHAFTLSLTNKKYNLRASSPEEKNAWTRLMIRARGDVAPLQPQTEEESN
eukprot:TRINITY_DN6459_c0_g1_i1.p1 TRINITY_DN6459_c0_g1~~TRINITY_DN6459_c0_g1_i1.p1  ORF type:complete len:416 (+),score=85.11 TRINITY_DN6459_c0_g1_i1:107-1354(+)